MQVSVWVSEGEFRRLESYSQREGLNVSEVLRRAALEKVEDEQDRIAFDEAIYAYERNPFSFSLDEVEKELRFR